MSVCRLSCGGVLLNVELALSPQQHARGLQDRLFLPENSGMLFSFSHPKRLSFWMKDTYIPLSIAFIDGSSKIVNIENMSPLSLESTKSEGNVLYALEVNSGWFRDNGVVVGDPVHVVLR